MPAPSDRTSGEPNDFDSTSKTAPRPDRQSNAVPANNSFFFLINQKDDTTPHPTEDSVPVPKRKHKLKRDMVSNVEHNPNNAKLKDSTDGLARTDQTPFTSRQTARSRLHKSGGAQPRPRTRLPTPTPKPQPSTKPQHSTKPQPSTRPILGYSQVPRPIRRHALDRPQMTSAPRPYWWPGPRPRHAIRSVWNQDCLKPEHELPELSRKLLGLLRHRGQRSVRRDPGPDASLDLSYADELDQYLQNT